MIIVSFMRFFPICLSECSFLLQQIERRGKAYNPLSIPRNLQKLLPFKDTPKILLEKKDPVKRVTVIREPHEAKVGTRPRGYRIFLVLNLFECKIYPAHKF